MVVPTAQLRVFAPVDTLGAGVRRRVEARLAANGGVTRAEAHAAERRLALAVQHGRSLPTDDDVLVRRVAGDTYVCPLDLRLRAARAYERLAEQVAAPVLVELVPAAPARRALAALSRVRRPAHVRDHPFGVPVAWYAAFAPGDRRRTDPPEGRGPRVRFVTHVAAASGRLERVGDALTPVAPDEDLDAIEDLRAWLAGFTGRALLELDYGDLARRVPAEHDRAADELAAAVDAADRGDLLAAATALAAARARWSGTVAQPDHC